MSLRLIGEGAQELMEKGVSDLSDLRPVLLANANNPMAANATLRKDEW